MSKDNLFFMEENPFRRLDKRRFRSKSDSMAGASTHKKLPTAHSGTDVREKKTLSSALSESMTASEDAADAATFLKAMTGTNPLAHRAKAQHNHPRRVTSDLENPVIPAIISPPRQPSRTKTDGPPVPDPQKGQTLSMESEDMSFASAMKGVTPLAGKGRAVSVENTLPVVSRYTTEDPNPLQEFMEGKLEFALASTDEYVEGHILGLDLITVGKLQAGQYSPEAHLDLHGLNAIQAFQMLVGFIKGAYLKGQRTLLVVSGRGRNSPQGMPVLRTKIQDWFTQEPFRRVILAFCTAKPADGGAGALYVLLRKRRKDRGKVYWDRKPADPDLL